jgi:hypothetical protein
MSVSAFSTLNKPMDSIGSSDLSKTSGTSPTKHEEFSHTSTMSSYAPYVWRAAVRDVIRYNTTVLNIVPRMNGTSRRVSGGAA